MTQDKIVYTWVNRHKIKVVSGKTPVKDFKSTISSLKNIFEDSVGYVPIKLIV